MKGGRKDFFFLKKKEAKKTLIHLDRGGETAWGLKEQKFFGSFFQKRTSLAVKSCTI
jgi:hypothetical protein